MIFEETKTDKNGNINITTTENTYDENGKILSERVFDKSSGEYLLSNEEYQYDSFGNLKKRKKYNAESGIDNTYIYDYLYDDTGKPKSYIEYEGEDKSKVVETCDYEYDSSGELVSEISEGEGYTDENYYNKDGDIIYSGRKLARGDEYITKYDDYGNTIYEYRTSDGTVFGEASLIEIYYEYESSDGIISCQHDIDV